MTSSTHLAGDGSGGGGVDESLYKSVVKIFTVATTPDFAQPWHKCRQESCTSSGFMIGDRRILTNAHGVLYFNSVRVRKHGESKKYIAKVLHIGHDCDLALLTVEDDAFWKDTESLAMGVVPQLQESVIVVGYPTGGDQISVTKGVVSRVGMGFYSHAGTVQLLTVQIDAAINSGNSGGPAMMGGTVVGVAFETLNDAENIGYIIPTTVIDHFLRDIERNGRYTGFVSVGFYYQQMENESLRKKFKLRDDQHGVLITKTKPLSSSDGVVRVHDVLLRVGGHAIADDGTVVFRSHQRISFTWVATKLFVGDSIELEVLRGGEIVTLNMKLRQAAFLVPPHLHNVRHPSYFIFAGLVFVRLSVPYLRDEFGRKWAEEAPISLCQATFHGMVEFEGQEVVVLSQILVHRVNIGYDVSNSIVERVNGVPVRNMRHLVRLIDESKEEFIRIDVKRFFSVIIDRKAGAASLTEVLEDNDIAKDRSDDMLGGEVEDDDDDKIAKEPTISGDVAAAAVDADERKQNKSSV